MEKSYEESIRPSRSAYMQVLLALIVNFSSIAPSMSLGFSAIALPSLQSPSNPYKIDSNQASWVASIASIATPIGCFVSGPVSDTFGRRSALMWTNVVCFIGWTIIAVADCYPEQQYVILLIGRLMTGLSTGLASMPAAVYMAEISTSKLRGVFTTWNAIFFSVGVLVVYTLGYFLKDNWGLTAAISAAFPCVGLFLVIVYMPESPSWLVSKGQILQAELNLRKLYNVKDYIPEVKDEVDALIANKEASEAKINKSEKPSSFDGKEGLKTLFDPTIFKPFIIMMAFFFFQQFSGVFVIVFYAVDIVVDAGVTMDPYLTIVLIAATRLVASILVSLMSKRYGRRPPTIVSGAGMTLCMIILAAYVFMGNEGKLDKAAISWIPATALVVYFFTSTLGFLTMPFAMAAEVFPAKVRGMATGLVTCVAYTFNFAIVKAYPSMVDGWGNHWVFFFYGSIALVGTLFVIMFLPETKGKSLREIEEYFGKKKERKSENVSILVKVDRF